MSLSRGPLDGIYDSSTTRAGYNIRLFSIKSEQDMQSDLPNQNL